MPEQQPPAEGTIRESRPGELTGGADVSRANLSVLHTSHQRFRILKTLGHGGLGVVSMGYDIELDRVVAIKEMRLSRPTEDDVQRFLLEARLTSQLDHPGIPPVYAMGYFEDGRPFYAMRLVEGMTLRTATKDFHAKYPLPDLSRQRSMRMRQLIGAVVSVCNTLRFAHAQGVLHRDIKPSNIMLGEYGETLLLDWGLAKSQKQSLPYSDLETKSQRQQKRWDDPEETGTGSVFGTPHYMSPEQASGDVESINQRSEVYSIGATLYFVLTGKPPVTGHNREEILEKVRRGDFLPPRMLDSRVPPELNAIVLKAMALERGDRYADSGELATDIEHWFADESVSCYQEPPSRRWQRWLRAHQAWVAGLVVLMATCFVGLLIGTYFVSLEHDAAVAALKKAERAESVAQQVTEKSRALISRTFVSTFNSRIRNVPGTERTRLEVLRLFIDQFEDWSKSDPESIRNRHELANALYERARIYDELNQLEMAWIDMQRSRIIFEELLQYPDPNLRAPCILARVQLLTDIARLMDERRWSTSGAEALMQETYHWLHRESDTISQSAAFSLYCGDVLLQLGILKRQRGQLNSAFELISQACDLNLRQASGQSREAVEDELLSGRLLVDSQRLHCLGEIAKTAFLLNDLDLAKQRASELSLAIANLNTESKEEIKVQLQNWDNEILLARLGCHDGQNGKTVSSLQRLKAVAVEIERALTLRPGNRMLYPRLIDAHVQIAEHEIFDGEIDKAQQHAAVAWRHCDALSQLFKGPAFYHCTRQVHALAIQLAKLRGDPAALVMHQSLQDELTTMAENCLPE